MLYREMCREPRILQRRRQARRQALTRQQHLQARKQQGQDMSRIL